MSMKTPGKTIPLAVLAALLILTAARAASLGPGIYNADNPAFGAANEDVPPDIGAVVFTPPQPRAAAPLAVTAEITIDGAMTPARVEQVWALVAVDGGGWERIELQRSAPGSDFWTAVLFNETPAGLIRVVLGAEETMGNTVREIPLSDSITWPPAPEEMFLLAAGDGRPEAPEHYPASMDMTEFHIAADADNAYFRIEYAAGIAPSTRGRFAHIYGVGCACPDIRLQPWEVNHELGKSRMVGYIPLMNKKGIFRSVEAIAGEPMAQAEILVRDNVLWIGFKRDDLAAPELLDLGGKFWAATAIVDIAEIGIPEPVDFLNYNLVYFRSHDFTVE